MRAEILLVLVIAAVLVVILFSRKSARGMAGKFLGRFGIDLPAERNNPGPTGHPDGENDHLTLKMEEESMAELERLQRLIEDKKQFARDTDIAHHLWGLYLSEFRHAEPQPADHRDQNGNWYDVFILRSSTSEDVKIVDFELKGRKYQFADDEEKQGWRDKMKFFSLFLYDDSGRCLIEVPMKMRVDAEGRNYSVLTDGPKAFLQGNWASDFISVWLKHRSMRNQDMRAQKHLERLREIEDLKDRFGVSD